MSIAPNRSEVRRDLLTPQLAQRFGAMLDRSSEREPAQGIHWCLCAPDAATSILSADGHAPRGDSIPEIDLDRRMWAASEVLFLEPLRVGAVIERRSAVVTTTEKQGASGRLLFVDMSHQTYADGTLSIEEQETIVYRGRGQSAPHPESGSPDWSVWPWRRELTPSPILLFRYSALTFNSHRIHYDLPWATIVEGYPGLVVHGPLIATLLLDLVDRTVGPNSINRFRLRVVSPAFAGEQLVLLGRPVDDGRILLSAQTAFGRVLVEAEARPVGRESNARRSELID